MVADYLRKRTRPGQRVLVLGSEPQVLILADRKSASRHPFFYQVVGSYKRSSSFRRQVIDDFRKYRPGYVVVVQHPRSWMADPQTIEPFLDSLNDLLNERYRMDALVIPDGASGIFVECRNQPELCDLSSGASKPGSGLGPPVMVLYRLDPGKAASQPFPGDMPAGTGPDLGSGGSC